MAGRLKHMERSHRSHRRDANVFLGFNRRAYSVAYAKQQRMTLGQKMAQMLAPLKQAMRKATDK